jgi:hypothetical protein
LRPVRGLDLPHAVLVPAATHLGAEPDVSANPDPVGKAVDVLPDLVAG